MKNKLFIPVEVVERHANLKKRFYCIDRFGDDHYGFVLRDYDEYSGEFNAQYKCNGYVITHVLEPITPLTQVIEDAADDFWNLWTDEIGISEDMTMTINSDVIKKIFISGATSIKTGAMWDKILTKGVTYCNCGYVDENEKNVCTKCKLPKIKHPPIPELTDEDINFLCGRHLSFWSGKIFKLMVISMKMYREELRKHQTN